MRLTIARESDSVACVSESTYQLPTDIAALQALLVATRAERDAAIAERDQALSQNHRLLHQLQRMQFGRRSEKLDPGQLSLAFEDIPARSGVGSRTAVSQLFVTTANPRQAEVRQLRAATDCFVPTSVTVPSAISQSRSPSNSSRSSERHASGSEPWWSTCGLRWISTLN